MNKSRLFIAFLIIFITKTTILLAQPQEWEEVQKYYNWHIPTTLASYSNSNKLLHIYNSIAESKEDKKNNRFSTVNSKIYFPKNLYYNIVEKPFEITFTIENCNDPENYKYTVFRDSKKEWYKGDIYYGITINYYNVSGNIESYTLFYCNNKYGGSSYCEIYNNKNYGWNLQYNSSYYGNSFVNISFDGEQTLSFSDGKAVRKKIYNFKYLSSIEICVGTAAEVKVHNLVIKRKTPYGMALPLINKAQEQMDNQNWIQASHTLTEALKTYKDHRIYLVRALCYANIDFHQSAIEDCNEALELAIDKDSKEAIYYLRGRVKLNLNDIEGAIEDLEKGGQNGVVFLRESGLLDYKIKNKQEQKATSRPQSKSQLTK